jgi:hypothetical protein
MQVNQRVSLIGIWKYNSCTQNNKLYRHLEAHLPQRDHHRVALLGRRAVDRAVRALPARPRVHVRMPLRQIAEAGVQMCAGGGGQVDQLLLVDDLDGRLELVGARRVADPRVDVAVGVRRLRLDGRRKQKHYKSTHGGVETLLLVFQNLVKHALTLDHGSI